MNLVEKIRSATKNHGRHIGLYLTALGSILYVGCQNVNVTVKEALNGQLQPGITVQLVDETANPAANYPAAVSNASGVAAVLAPAKDTDSIDVLASGAGFTPYNGRASYLPGQTVGTLKANPNVWVIPTGNMSDYNLPNNPNTNQPYQSLAEMIAVAQGCYPGAQDESICERWNDADLPIKIWPNYDGMPGGQTGFYAQGFHDFIDEFNTKIGPHLGGKQFVQEADHDLMDETGIDMYYGNDNSNSSVDIWNPDNTPKWGWVYISYGFGSATEVRDVTAHEILHDIAFPHWDPNGASGSGGAALSKAEEDVIGSRYNMPNLYEMRTVLP